MLFRSNAATQGLLATVRGMLAPAGLSEMTESALSTLYLGRMVAAQATALAFQDTFFVFAIVGLCAVVLALALWTPFRRTS